MCVVTGPARMLFLVTRVPEGLIGVVRLLSARFAVMVVGVHVKRGGGG